MDKIAALLLCAGIIGGFSWLLYTLGKESGESTGFDNGYFWAQQDLKQPRDEHGRFVKR
jgi:hypothetical protein